METSLALDSVEGLWATKYTHTQKMIILQDETGPRFELLQRKLFLKRDGNGRSGWFAGVARPK